MAGDARTALGGAPRPVRVLVNALHARSGGGVTYLRNLLPGLAADAGLDVHLCVHAEQAGAAPDDARIRVHRARFRPGFYRTLAWEQALLPILARRIGADVVFSPANFGPLLAPRPVVLLRNALDVGKSERRWRKRLYWTVLSLMTAASALRAPRLLAVSEYARRALTRRLPDAVRRRTAVVHHGVDPLFSPPPAEAARQDFLLAVGDLYVQKNLHGLVAALDILRRGVPEVRLKIAGRPVDADYADRVAAEIAGRGLGEHVELLGHVAPVALAELYRRCALFVFPSLVETFGNPLVEAMASGAPIVSADSAAMPEVLGDAALFFDPEDTAQMAARLATALADEALRRDLGARALARASRFSWAETARLTAALLKDCAGR